MKTDDLITLMTQDAPVGMRYGRIIFDDAHAALDQAAMDRIYSGSPHADRSDDLKAAS